MKFRVNRTRLTVLAVLALSLAGTLSAQSINPTTLTFTAAVGGAAPAKQNVLITHANPITITTAVTTPVGGTWLSYDVPPMTGPGFTSLAVSANPAGLALGSYSGTITVTTTGTGTLIGTVNVTFAITAATGLVISPTGALTFVGAPGGAQPAGQTLAVSTSSGTNVAYTVTAATIPAGGTWLSVTPLAGTTPSSVLVNANTTGLVANTYNGTLTFASTGLPSIVVNVTLSVTTQAFLSVTPTALTYNFITTGAVPASQTLTVSVTSGATVIQPVVATTSGGAWLSVSPPVTNVNAGSPVPLTVNVAPLGLAVGTYSGSITITAATFANSPQIIPVTLNVTTTGQLQLTANPASITFNTPPGGNPPPIQTIAIGSTGVALSYTVTFATTTPVGGNWLAVGPLSANTPSSISVGAGVAGLAAGTYSGTITVTAPGATNSPLQIPVTLILSNDPLLELSAPSLSFNFQSGAAAPSGRTVIVKTSTGSPVGFTATATTTTGGSWLNVIPTSGSTTGAVVVTVSPAGLAAGSYSGTVTFTAAGVANSPRTLPVTLNVSTSPLLSVNTNPLAFAYQTGGANPASQSIAVASTGNAVNFTATASAAGGLNWLTASAGGGTTPSNVTVSANAAGLTPGVYSGTVTISSNDTGNTPLTVPVTLTVAASALLTTGTSGLTFTFAGGSATPSQTVSVGSTIGALTFTPVASVITGGNWLSVSTSSTITPATLTVSVNQVGLADGFYYGLISLVSTGVGNSPLILPVTLSVSNTSAIILGATSLTFNQMSGGTAPLGQNVLISSGGTVLSYGVTITTASGGNWLNVSPTAGITPSNITVTVNGGQLSAGTYNGTITISAAGAPNSPQTIAVTLVVATPPTVSAAPNSLNFQGQVNSTTQPAAQTVQLSSGTTAVAFIATASTVTGGVWLSVSPNTGNTPVQLRISVNTAGLAAGTYSGSITISPSGVTFNPLVIPVTLTIASPPTGVVTSVTNGATFLPTAVAPGQILAIFGNNLGPPTLVGLRLTPQGLVDTTLSGMRVLFDGIPAPLLYVRNDQLGCVVPYAVFGRFTTRMQVENQGALSTPIELNVRDAAPGIFSLDASGRGPGAILNQDGSVNSPANLAPRGSVVVIYATGDGQTNPPGIDGTVNGATLKRPLLPVSVRIGGQIISGADILYAGSAPGFVSGAVQVNVRLTDNIPTGVAVPIELIVGGFASTGNVTIAVR